MQTLIGFLNQYVSQSKYDFRSKSEAFCNFRALTPSTSLKSNDEIKGDSDLGFHTLYCGPDPIERTRMLIRSIVRIPVADEKAKNPKIPRYMHCLEETTITRYFSHP